MSEDLSFRESVFCFCKVSALPDQKTQKKGKIYISGFFPDQDSLLSGFSPFRILSFQDSLLSGFSQKIKNKEIKNKEIKNKEIKDKEIKNKEIGKIRK